MRFDDILSTVLTAERRAPAAARAAWRQLVDLVGRGRVAASDEVMAELASLSAGVPRDVRAASARALAGANPPAALVRLLARDAPAVAAPVLRTARLDVEAWIRLLPELGPEGRAVLRHRRDLPREVEAALAGFAPLDFLLPAGAPPVPPVRVAVRPARGSDAGTFQIADVVARIEAFRERQEAARVAPAVRGPVVEDRFHFATDAAGTIRAADTVFRGAVVGLSIARIARPGGAGVDGVAAGAFRRRGRIRLARLAVAEGTPMGGAWRIAADPEFDRSTGRFTGYRGDARRLDAATGAGGDALRQVVHELRTPTNAIQGFAEMIATEMLGPVAPAYRAQAGAIRADGARLLAAIGDLDAAGRAAGGALALEPEAVPLSDLLREIAGARPDANLVLPDGDATVVADRRQLERMIGRMVDIMAGAAAPGEAVPLSLHAAAGARAALSIGRPRALAAWPGDALLDLDDETAPAALLGTGFALRLVRRLAEASGGALSFGRARLTLYLPVALGRSMGRTRRLS